MDGFSSPMKNIDQLFKRYERDKLAAGGSSQTMDHVRSALRLFGRFLGDIEVEKVTTDQAKDFVAWLRDRNVWKDTTHAKEKMLSATSINTYFRAIKGFWVWLKEEKIIAENPLAGVQAPKFPKMLPKIFTEEQMKAVFSQLVEGKREHALIFLFLDSGARLAEIAGLDLNLIDLTDRRARIIGKNRVERPVYFSPSTAHSIKLYIDTERPKAVSTNRLFLTEKGNPLTSNRIQKIMVWVGKRANLPDRLSPQKLRHTYATLSLKYGGNLEYLRNTLGHTDIKTTSDFYLNVEDSDVAASYETSSPVANLQKPPNDNRQPDTTRADDKKPEQFVALSNQASSSSVEVTQSLQELKKTKIAAGTMIIDVVEVFLKLWGDFVAGSRSADLLTRFHAEFTLGTVDFKLVCHAWDRIMERLGLLDLITPEQRRVGKWGAEVTYWVLTPLGKKVVLKIMQD
jgi:site-specific recombinase XerD